MKTCRVVRRRVACSNEVRRYEDIAESRRNGGQAGRRTTEGDSLRDMARRIKGYVRTLARA